MKMMILGVGTFICGVIVLCTDYIVTRVLEAIPGVYIIDGVAVFSLTHIAWVIMLLGVILTVKGYRDK